MDWGAHVSPEMEKPMALPRYGDALWVYRPTAIARHACPGPHALLVYAGPLWVDTDGALCYNHRSVAGASRPAAMHRAVHIMSSHPQGELHADH